MPLSLIPPGSRKGNRFWLVRGTIDGRRIEVSSQTTNETAARAFKEAIERELAESRVPKHGADVTFAQAARFYSDFRKPSKIDEKRIADVVRELGSQLVREIVHADLVKAADALKPGCAAATKNREVMATAASIMHYASKNGWCGWLRVELFRGTKPKTRSTTYEVAKTLIGATDGKKRLLLLWLYKQGDRVSDPLKIKWDHIDLQRGIVSYVMAKKDEERTAPIDHELLVMLANEEKKEGWVFPWRTRFGVYKWLRPLTKELGVTFTPHMARHSVGKWLNDEGAGLRTIMQKLGHTDAKSSLRYQAGDIEVVRAASEKMQSLLSPSNARGNETKKARKA